MEFVIVDTGVWYALFDRRDAHHGDADEKAELLEILAASTNSPAREIGNIGRVSGDETVEIARGADTGGGIPSPLAARDRYEQTRAYTQ